MTVFPRFALDEFWWIDALKVQRKTGPSEKTIHTRHKTLGKGKRYEPNGERECARRRRQMEKR